MEQLHSAAQEHNILLPESFDIVWSLVVTVVIGIVVWKYFVPRFMKVLDERTEKIQGGLIQAQEAQEEARKIAQKNKLEVDKALAEAAKIREEARIEGQKILTSMTERAESEAQRIVESGQRDLESQRRQIVASLRRDVGMQSVLLTESLLQKSLKDDEQIHQTVDQFVRNPENA